MHQAGRVAALCSHASMRRVPSSMPSAACRSRPDGGPLARHLARRRAPLDRDRGQHPDRGAGSAPSGGGQGGWARRPGRVPRGSRLRRRCCLGVRARDLAGEWLAGHGRSHHRGDTRDPSPRGRASLEGPATARARRGRAPRFVPAARHPPVRIGDATARLDRGGRAHERLGRAGLLGSRHRLAPDRAPPR